MRVVITGATGLLGGNLAEACLAAGHQVVATRRATSRLDHLEDLDLTWVEAPLEDVDALARAFDQADAVFHCAARTSLLARPTPALRAANVHGTEHVLEAVARAGAGRLVHVSSTVAVGVSDTGEPCTETSPWNLETHGLADGYARTKRWAEARVLDAAAQGLDAVVVNPGFLLGPRDARPSSGQLVLEIARGQARLAPGGSNSFVDVRDVAQGMLSAHARGTAGQRYILAGHNLPYSDMFARISHIVRDSLSVGIPLRIGIDHGPVIEYRLGDYRGLVANIAARLSSMAEAGQVTVTDRVVRAACLAGPTRPCPIRGVRECQRVRTLTVDRSIASFA